MESIFHLVADAGGSGTDWWLWTPRMEHPLIFTSGGINATVSTKEEICDSLVSLSEILNSLPFSRTDRSLLINFYGAGCNSVESAERLKDVFESIFVKDSIRLYCHSDLEGAGKALFGDESGVACILGTGSASGLYDGRSIIDSVPSLGYILGDEGSGSFMGKMLINKYFKRELSPRVCRLLESFSNMSMPEVLRRVFREGYPAKYLASFVPFIKENENVEEISTLIENSLKLFFEKNVLKYSCNPGTSVGFVGGVGNAFSSRLQKIAEDFNLTADLFIARPINALGNYYKTRITL